MKTGNWKKTTWRVAAPFDVWSCSKAEKTIGQFKDMLNQDKRNRKQHPIKMTAKTEASRC